MATIPAWPLQLTKDSKFTQFSPSSSNNPEILAPLCKLSKWLIEATYSPWSGSEKLLLLPPKNLRYLMTVIYLLSVQ